MCSWFLGVALVAVAAGQDPGEIPIGASPVMKPDLERLASGDGGRRLLAGGAVGIVDGKVRELIRSGAQTLPVFIVLRDQPHREVLERYESPARLRLQMLEGRYAELSRQIIPSEPQLSLARSDLEREMLDVRRAAFREIEARIRPEQDQVEALLASFGARNIRRYSAINMLAAEVPAAAVDTLAAHPAVAEISLIEKQSAQLDVSVPSLGAPVFWAAGYTGAGESVAVMDTGVRTSHPAFSGLNIVSKVFLDYAKQDPCFGDDATSPEDKQGHGTHVAGIVASRGAPGWSNYWGVARGLGTLYNLKIAYLDKCTGGGRFQGNDPVAALNWAVQQAPWVKVINFSSGGDAGGDDDVLARLFDYFADTYGLTISVAAGNESKSGFLGLWTKPGPVSSPGIGYNVITVAAMNTQGTIDRSDDEIAIFSSRGPTVGGRKKPDIAAPGGLRDDWRLSGWQPVLGIWSADYQSDGFRKDSGTSMAAPHIAGAAALLRQAGVRDPLAIKALLLNTTDWLNWGNDQGWGYANLTRAFSQRNGVLTSTLSSGRVRLYKGVTNGLFYSTLTWNRSVYQGFTSACLSDLDLFLYSGLSGVLLGSSVSVVDNVEKAYATAYGPVVVNVTHWSQSSCRSPERFGVAFSVPGFQPATGPVLDVSCTAPTAVAPSAQFSAACTIANRGDLPALSVQGALGFAGSTSSSSQDFGTIQPGGSSTKTWLVTAPGSIGTFTLQLAAQSNSFGALFSGSARITFSTTSGVCTVAVSPTALSFPAAGGSGTVSVWAPAGCSWQALSNAPWITVTGGAQGSGNGTVAFTVAANTGSSARTGTIAVGGQAVAISQAGASSAPVVTSVVNGASFQPGIAAGAWISIFGTNLSTTTRTWRNDELVGGILPTQLDGVRVTVNGRMAAVYYISPTQLNVQVPSDEAVGPVQVQVTTPHGTATTTAQMQAFAPSLFLFDRENRRYVAAQHASDYGLVGKVGLYPASTPAKPGEIVILYGTGFGPTNPPLPTGRVITEPARLANPVQVRIGGLPADVLWAGLSAPGLYQFNVKIPEALPDGDHTVLVVVAGWPTQSNVFITVQR
jgi:uncharacterized protein (TIGR03437 family)